MIYTSKEDIYIIMIPMFNDWESVTKLLPALDSLLSISNINVQVLIVDDASITPFDNKLLTFNFKAIQKIDVLELRRNLGHQRAIAVGLAYVEANLECEALLVMDGDGEDKPEDVLRLIETYQKENKKKVVFARRVKRSENLLFKLLYGQYKWIYKLLTGYDIRVGNFSIVPFQTLGKLVAVAEIWNHYAAGLQKAKVQYVEIPTNRGLRTIGESKMNLVSLVTHGLSSISVYGDIVGTRLLVLSSIILLLVILLIFSLTTIRLITVGIPTSPGWISYIIGLLFTVLMQAILFSFFFIVTILNGRNNAVFLPCRDYHYLIWKSYPIFQNLKIIHTNFR